MSEIRVHFRPSFDVDEDGVRTVSIDCSAFYASDEEVIEDTDDVVYFNEVRLTYTIGDTVNDEFGPQLKDFLRASGWSSKEEDLSFVLTAVLNSAELRYGVIPHGENYS